MIARLIYKDILRRIKNPGGFIVALILPLAFALLLGLVFGSGRGDESIIQVKLLIEDHDQSFASQFLTGAFSRGKLQEMFVVIQVDSLKGRPMMDDGEASALIIIPAGFGDSLLQRKSVFLTLVKNPGESYAPKIAEETVSIMAEGLDRVLRIAEKPLSMIQKQIEKDDPLSEAQMVLISIEVYQLIKKLDTYLFPARITLNEKTVESDEDAGGFSMSVMYASILCGVVVMSLLFMLDVLARDFFVENEQHTLYRLLVSPAGIRKFVLAKLMFVFLTGYASHLLVWLAGGLFFGIRLQFIQVLNLLVFSIVMMSGLTGVISLIYGLARTRSQVQSMASAIIIAFSMLGGAMMPLEALPEFVQRVAVISPVFWSVNGLKAIVLNASNLIQLRVHMMVLGAIAVMFLAISSVLYQRKYRL